MFFCVFVFFFKQKTAYEMRISDWSSDVCSSDLATFPPFELEKDGKLEGFDIDMIKAIAKAENHNIKLKTMPFDGIIPSLKVGSIAAAVPAIKIKESRMSNPNFSNSYSNSDMAVPVRADSKNKCCDELHSNNIPKK